MYYSWDKNQVCIVSGENKSLSKYMAVESWWDSQCSVSSVIWWRRPNKNQTEEGYQIKTFKLINKLFVNMCLDICTVNCWCPGFYKVLQTYCLWY